MNQLGNNQRYNVTEEGLTEQPYTDKNDKNTKIGTDRFYNQEYSIIYGRAEMVRYNNGESYSPRFNIRGVHGNLTSVDNLPNEGRATYSGVAFGAFDQGEFNYTIDFANRTGQGNIRNLADVADKAEVILETGEINGNSITSTVRAHIEPLNTSEQAYAPYDLTGRYMLGIYGPNAEEVAGKVVLDNINRDQMLRANPKTGGNGYTAEIGFGGKRGEITK